MGLAANGDQNRSTNNLVESADSFSPFARLGLLHLTIPVEAVEELFPRSLPAHLERTPEGSHTDLAIHRAVLRLAVLPPARLPVQNRVHEPSGRRRRTDGVFVTTRATARAAPACVGRTPGT